MNYKLIKDYPGSPSLGFIASPKHDSAYYVNSNWIQPENHPEFWELIVEKDYEILEIKGKYGAISSYIEKLDNDLKDKTIFKIKRLSDGEVFTIGDLVGTPGSMYPLKEFKIIDSENTLAVHCYKDKIGGSGHYNHRLKNLKKAKQPLFTTEDGVDIYEGDNIIYYIDTKYLNQGVKNSSAYICSTSQKGDYLFYKSKEKAEEYVFMNKPVLSLKDVASIYISADKPITETTSFSAQNRRIQELVKAKINNK